MTQTQTDSRKCREFLLNLESLPRKSEVYDRPGKMMSIELRKGWDKILEYLSGLSGGQ